MKIWIVHNTIYGNGKLAAKTLAKIFNEHEVRITHNRDVSPKTIVESDLDLLIFGTAVRKFVVSWESKRWLKNVNKELKKEGKEIPFLASFVTHGRDLVHIYKPLSKLRKLLNDLEGFNHVYPILLTPQVQNLEGPFKAGEMEKFDKDGMRIFEWIKSLTVSAETIQI